MSNYYDILKVKTNASQPEIKAAYKRLALVHHPDRNRGEKESEETFKMVYEAYKTLSNASRRRLYDHKIHVHKAPQVTYNEGGLYRSLFNRNGIINSPGYHKPEVFQSKRKDMDFYLFWVTAAFIIILIGIFALKF